MAPAAEFELAGHGAHWPWLNLTKLPRPGGPVCIRTLHNAAHLRIGRHTSTTCNILWPPSLAARHLTTAMQDTHGHKRVAISSKGTRAQHVAGATPWSKLVKYSASQTKWHTVAGQRSESKEWKGGIGASAADEGSLRSAKGTEERGENKGSHRSLCQINLKKLFKKANPAVPTQIAQNPNNSNGTGKLARASAQVRRKDRAKEPNSRLPMQEMRPASCILCWYGSALPYHGGE